MVNLTLKIPDALKVKMKQHNEIRWSEVIRKTIEQKISDLEFLDQLTAKSKLTTEKVAEISKKIDSNVSKKLGFIYDHY